MALARHAGRPLKNRTLGIHAARAAVPTYERKALQPGVVHFGVGGFHRAHQAVYLEELAERGISNEWGVTGVSLNHSAMRDSLAPQDWLYTLVERGEDGDQARIIGVMGSCLFARQEAAAVLGKLAATETRLVTMTVTGDGYNIDPTTGEFRHDRPGTLADLRLPERPSTVIGYIVEGLRLRRDAGLPPFTVLSCDNLPSNGAVAREAVVSLARLRDPDLAGWIECEGAFPSSVVDRITPKTGEAARRLVLDDFGIADRWPVVAEPYSQWIIEDHFCNGRPPLDEVGAKFVSDIAPYELTKKRLLNGSHCALGYLGYLAGHRRSADAMEEELIRDYLEATMEDEVSPLLPEAPGMDLAEYRETLLERFSNPSVGDQLSRLCARGSTKMPAYLLPSAADAVAARRPHSLLALAVAAWFQYLRGTDAHGASIDVEDAQADRLQGLAQAGGCDPRPLLQDRSLFGELGESGAFTSEVARSMRSLERHGPLGTLNACQRPKLSLAA
ncbi:MAG: mannitol dehydrogenase family protein [Solirubrobacterales bacterium]|nr:mannitol dehydrogenase family protein [Solirubrobacterales bacterium]